MTAITARPVNVIYRDALPNVPGMDIAMIELHWGPTEQSARIDHRHPGPVYVYVTEGVLRIGVEGEPVEEIAAGGMFVEPPNRVHTVAESASATQGASAIAVMIVPKDAPLTTFD